MSVSRLAAAAALFSSAVLVAGTGTSTECCEALVGALGSDQVYFPGTDEYDDKLQAIWASSARQAPWCFVLPASANDVSATITTLTAGECPFGIVGGGHAYFRLSNSVEEGVTIDFKLMNTTTYNEETKIASLQPGGHWGGAYATLAEYGVTVAGGRITPVGIGGFVLGGGVSFYSPRYGFTADTVDNFEIVLANGTITDANADYNADLFRALKGGSGNFGLVTRIDMNAIEFAQTDEPGEIYGGLIQYDPEDEDVVDGLIEAFVDFAHVTEESRDASGVIWWVFDYALGGMTMTACLDQTQNNGADPSYDGFLALPSVSSTLRHDTLVGITDELVFGGDLYYVSMSGAYKADARIVKFAKQKHDQLIQDIEALIGTENTGISSQSQFQPMSKQMLHHGAENGGNAMGLESREATGDGINWQLMVGVNTAEDAAAIAPLLYDAYYAVNDYADSLDSNWNWIYLNYAFGTQDPLESTGADTVAMLRAVSQKYDPQGVFQTLRGSGFKIPTD